MSVQLVVELTWSEGGGIPRQETYGPWTAADDSSHLGEIRDFIARWQAVTGQAIQRAVIAILQDPAGWLAGERERREAGT